MVPLIAVNCTEERKRPVAVLTIVLYFGTDKMWDKPTHLKDVIYIPEGLGEYVNDYKITVFNICMVDGRRDCKI